MSLLKQEIVDFHREVTQKELDAIDTGDTLTPEQLYKIAKKIYNLYYESKVPVEELEKYRPKYEDK